MPTPDAQYYRDEAARCRDLATMHTDRFMAARWREVADEYEQAAEGVAALDRSSTVQRTAMQQQPRQQQQARSGPPEPSQLNMSKQIRPACAECGQPTWLIRIEPAPEPDHDLRTFECPACGVSRLVKVKFR
jgi:DNA-directed RNA polymerase subunit RPC12/RpoP